MHLFYNKNSKLRNFWWIVVFFLILGSFTLPAILIAKHYGWEVTMWMQALLVVAATYVCQLLRRKPLIEVTGVLNSVWIKHFGIGLGIGAALMLIPAGCLYLGGWISWQATSFDMNLIIQAAGLYLCVAVAEEFLFRGFLFQRLGNGFGYVPAQLIISAYFLLTHMNNPGMTGNTRVIASVNIFLASILLGYAFIKTKSLAMPLAIHFMANFVQGTVLGFGVSGNEQTGLLKPIFNEAPQWLTGGSFGLEASVPGLICVMLALVLMGIWRGDSIKAWRPEII
ncbi:MAG: CPBP family intramembrane metalloprotease [Bacteroidetes bacterium]|nr:CPBP family intramembrane metalloprotease [Bacteroidota bacterium]